MQAPHPASAMRPSALEVSRLDLQRGRNLLASDVEFRLASGRYLEVRGANGSGKSTLLRILAGVQSASRHARITHSGGVFHFATRSGFRPELVVREQLAISLALYGQPRDEAWLDRVGLRKQAGRRVGELSDGQMRRLMLAVMAGSGQPLWLIDEPLNALDAAGVALLGDLLAEHLARGGAAVIATHQSLAERLPALERHCAGTLLIENGAATFTAREADGAEGDHATPSAPSVPAALAWVARREIALIAARPQDALWPAIFHFMVVSLFPFALGTDGALLIRIAPGVFWVSALLALLLAAQRLFAADHEHGTLAQIRSARLPLAAVAAGKMLATFVSVGLPLALATLPLGVQYNLPVDELLVLAGSLALGLVSVCALVCLFAALGLMARQAQVVVSLMALPAFVPVLIFGTAAVGSLQAGLSAQAPLAVLGTLAVLSLIAAPVVSARVLELALD